MFCIINKQKLNNTEEKIRCVFPFDIVKWEEVSQQTSYSTTITKNNTSLSILIHNFLIA